VFVLKLARIAIAAVAAAGVVTPTAPVAAATTICVGLVVDARPLGGPVSADCATVPGGSTGYDVLRAAGHTVGFRHDGLICTIDNRPADGCAATDAQHYWAYFHRKPQSSSWSYSNEGATTYQPDNGATEGWVWRNGDSATPKDVPYTTICPKTASPTPRPSSPPPSASAQPTRSAHPQPVARTTKTTSPTAATRRSSHQRRSERRTTPPAVDPSPTSTAATVAAITSKPGNGSSGPPWGLIAGAAVIAVFGGAAAGRWRHRGTE
jgi:hypothetical protein